MIGNNEFNQLHGELVESDFAPPWWARNRHIQTIWPRFFQRRRSFFPRIQRLKLPDGDFVDLAWGRQKNNFKGIVVIFHGLEGSVNSHYANDVMAHFEQQDWMPVLMHFRGCSGAANLTQRAYHSGDTEDALYFLDWLENLYPDVPKAAVGFSLGANMLLKLLGENPQQMNLKAAVAISPPMRLEECASSINQGFSRLYQKYLLKSMVNNLIDKLEDVDYSAFPMINREKVKSLKSFREFDDLITAPVHGFGNADNYYEKCSAMGFLKKIMNPTLILHAKDDPFMNEAVIPLASDLSPFVRYELSEKGGHVGFMQGSPINPRIWFHTRVSDFLKPFLQANQ